MTYIDRQYYINIAMGGYSNIATWSKIGYTPTMNTTESDIWSAAGVYTFPTAAAGMEVVSSDNTADIGTVIHSGTTTTGGSTTTLQKTGENFLTTTAAGDFIIVDKAGTTPEWGIITAVDSDTQITFANGLSSGGSGASRATYSIIDYSDKTGAQAVKVDYLDGSYAEKVEIVIMNGTTVVATTNTDLFRINSFRVIAAGSDQKCKGNLTIRNLADTPVYSYITANYTRARNTMYTVPASKTLYVFSWNASFGVSGTGKVEYCRMYTRANLEPSTRFRTGSLFFPYTEVDLMNGTSQIEFLTPTKLPAKTDIRVSGISSAAGVAATVLRGYLVS